MTFQVQLKSQISERELDDAVDVCVRAYIGELASNSMVGGDESLKAAIWRAMIRAGLLDGEVYFATDDSSHKVVGVAVWFPPGKSLFDSEEQRALGFDDFMKKLSPETQEFWANSYVPVVDKFLAEVIGPSASSSSQPFTGCMIIDSNMQGTRDSQYLNQLATDPAFQKKGIATMLLKTFAESDNPPMFAHCAANEKNARFYESCGYTIKGKMFLDAPTGGYPVIVLTK
ncbi:N-acetyltransferase domain-containing protein [Mycena venus]|uniref:N-acetyltransferase domain-containing protein n=1 Tax=Mycena venus TaxID=2733690 RepID=A0A8H7CBQ6_9AGAR|nr:N-acetyltransferase domain-containing protein [Mycena venus]